ncbi:MAG: hypothetical protein ACP5NX_01060 [Candidatus Bilamarchaeaceae archaeon]
MMSQTSRMGQVSIEYLLVSAVLLSVLFFSVFSLYQIKEASDRQLASFRFQQDAQSLADRASRVCVLGSGSSAEYELSASSSTPISVYYENGVIEFSSMNLSKAFPTRCEAESGTIPRRGGVKNDGGVIVFR